MTCATCVARVERVLKADPDVASATVNLVTNRAEVTLSGDAPTERLIARVAKSGYGAHLVKPDEKDGNAAEAARLWRDTWIALALTLPVFLVEMGGHLYPQFHMWVHMNFGTQVMGLAELVLTAAVLAGPGFRFFQKGLPALVQLAPDMNSLIALGAGAAFLYSSLVVLVP